MSFIKISSCLQPENNNKKGYFLDRNTYFNSEIYLFLSLRNLQKVTQQKHQ